MSRRTGLRRQILNRYTLITFVAGLFLNERIRNIIAARIIDLLLFPVDTLSQFLRQLQRLYIN